MIYSDMRQNTNELDLESPSTVPTFSSTSKQVANTLDGFRGAKVYVLGADGAGKPIAYWHNLGQFWMDLFQCYSGVHYELFDFAQRFKAR